MPMMLLNDELFDKECSKFINQNEQAKVVNIMRGRGNKVETPQALREVIASEAIQHGNTASLAEVFGVSKSSVDAYKHGSTSTKSYNEPSERLKVVTDGVKEDISTKARARLMDALDEITPDRIAGAKIKDIASIAKDMSAIVKNMEPEINLQQNNTQVIVYKPNLRNEDDFDIIQVNE